MTTYYVPEAQLRRLLGEREGISTFAPAETRRFSWMDLTGEGPSPAALAHARSAQSPKGFFLPAAESLGRYGPGCAAATSAEARPRVLAGVRACELKARDYLDKVMLEGPFADPPYAERRDAATIISCDCVDCAESCFCTSVGGRPFATEGYDVNLTPIEGGYVADAATERGEQWLGRPPAKDISQATPEQIARRDELRREMVERLGKQNAEFGLDVSDQAPPKLPQDDDEAWQQFAADCVECGACTNICPTCHCFYLYDQSLGPEEFERVRTWDSCLLSSYHRMAGGPGMKLTQKAGLFSRLANRVLHKFAYSPQQYEMLGCVGCGRCVEACLGAIDIRRVVQVLGGPGEEVGQ